MATSVSTLCGFPPIADWPGRLNHGLELARGRYIARQDQDDVSDPTRLAKQVAFMEANPECGLLGTRAQIWVGDTPTQRAHDHPIDNATLQLDLMFNNPFVHSSVMMRRSALNAVGGYTTDPSRQPPEDYELWSRISRRYLIANLPERLLIYRETPNSMSRVGPNPFLDKLVLITSENIAYHAGLDSPDQRCRDAGALVHAAYHKVSRRSRYRRTFAGSFPPLSTGSLHRPERSACANEPRPWSRRYGISSPQYLDLAHLLQR